ncbi:MAG: LysR family transcriptional regulator [Burkholderiaceae bacterium]|jgi:DNA-binding transcriptional LysR family regulator
MAPIDLNVLRAFVVVARERSFTRAAAQLGISQSALSHSMRGLEAKLGIRLLTRTTRGVSPTEAGERLWASIGPHYDGIESGLTNLSELRDRPAGTIRITSGDHAVTTVLWPKLSKFIPDYPDINVEIDINYQLIDIVAERFDAGVRSGEQIAQDMVAVRIGPPYRMAVVGSPDYLARKSAPQTPKDLADHSCVNLRLPTRGGLYAWEFEDRGQVIQVQVRGQWIFNTTPQMIQAAQEGCGLAYVPQDLVLEDVAAGHLLLMLEDYCPTYPGYHLYFPSRRQSSPAFSLLLETLRHRD